MSSDDDGLRFVVFGRAQQKGSKRVLPIRGRQQVGLGNVVLVDSNKNAAPWARQVSSAAAEAMAQAGRDKLIRTGVLIEMRFCFARPRSHFGMGRNATRVRPSAPREMVSMPDIDKLCRCALDALSGVVLHDDALVAELHASKCYGEPERMEVAVHEL